MKTILDNEGNRKLFKRCLNVNSNRQKLVRSFTVNVWLYGPGYSYDAGFHYYGQLKRLGKQSPPVKRAAFQSDHYRENVGYRIRIWPHGPDLP
jgi:hypothetical protein